MNTTTITTTTFTLMQGATPVSGTVAYSGVTATFTPASNLASSAVYTATITTGAKDLAGNPLAINYVWSFTTGAAPDTTAPTVTLTVPSNNATDVAINSAIAATFSEAMDTSTITATTFTLMQGTTPVSGAVTYSGVTAVFTPAGNLTSSTIYNATITTGVKDLAGNAKASNYIWSFTTGAAADTTAPTVSSTVPVNVATGVAINTTIAASFSEAMDPLTVTTATFTLMQGATPVSGTVTYSGVTAVFTPASNLAASTIYNATVTTGAKDLAGNAKAGNYIWSFTTGAAADTTAPTVSSTVPVNVATGVAINATIAASFSEAMAPLTITTTTFTLMQGTTPVLGTVAYSGVTAVFTPESNLASSTIYNATVTTGAKDLASNPLASNKVWSFTTGAAADTTAPTISFTVPADVATDVAINTTIAATFSEAMAPLTVTTTTFTLIQGTTPVSGTVSYSGVTAVFTPASNLTASTIYNATITTGVKDLAGNPLASNKVWSFTTGAAADTTAPTVTIVNPADIANGVAVNSSVNATFSEAMDPLTVTTATFTLMQGATPVSGTVAYSSVTAVFTPLSDLAGSTVYTATITTGAKDLASNALTTNKVWSFTTGTVAALGPAPVLLGMAGNYVILAKTAVSTVPNSAITGDVGLSPAATSFLTGFSLTMVGTTSATSPQVTGSLYGADMTTPTSSNLTTAITNMGTAYTDAAGRPTPDFLNLGAGEIGGQTLVPGLYKWSSGATAVTISTDVTISGNANDVWIFQIPGNLSISSAKSILLGGNAMAKNIFWQVAGTVNIGTTAHFEGIILSQTSITLGTGASLNGRALAQTAVALDQSTVTTPAQ